MGGDQVVVWASKIDVRVGVPEEVRRSRGWCEDPGGRLRSHEVVVS